MHQFNHYIIILIILLSTITIVTTITTTTTTTSSALQQIQLTTILDNNLTNNNFYNENYMNNEHHLEPWAYHLTALILFLIGFIGFTFNLFVIILMYKDIQLWTPMNIILLNLVCSDFLVSIFGNPFTLIAAISHQWIFGTILCIAYGFFMSLFGITSITTLTVLSYERYCLVRYPLSNRKINKNGAILCIILIWIYSLLLTLPPLFGWGAYVNEAANISCSVNWETQSFNATTYIIYLFIFGLIIPLIIIIYSYSNIIITMKRNSMRLGKKNRAEKRITYMVAIMITAFLIAWTPYSIFALIEQFGPSDLITPQMAVLPALIAKSSICYNPIIYIGLNTQFKASWKRNLFRETTIMETTVNQLSQTSELMIAIDSTPKLIRQNRNQKFGMTASTTTNSSSTTTNTSGTLVNSTTNNPTMNRNKQQQQQVMLRNRNRIHKYNKKILFKNQYQQNLNHNNNNNNNNNFDINNMNNMKNNDDDYNNSCSNVAAINYNNYPTTNYNDDDDDEPLKKNLSVKKRVTIARQDKHNPTKCLKSYKREDLYKMVIPENEQMSDIQGDLQKSIICKSKLNNDHDDSDPNVAEENTTQLQPILVQKINDEILATSSTSTPTTTTSTATIADNDNDDNGSLVPTSNLHTTQHDMSVISINDRITTILTTEIETDDDDASTKNPKLCNIGNTFGTQV